MEEPKAVQWSLRPKLGACNAMRRWLLAGLLGWAALIALPCLAQPTQERVLTVWGLGQSPDEKGFDDLVRAFEAKNPGVRVRVLSMGAGAMNPQKLMTAIVGNVPPDMVRQDRFTISDWASRGAFRPLDDLIARDKDRDPNTPTSDKYYPAVWQEASYQGKVYGVPIGADNRLLYWNKAVFREKAAELTAAGLDPTRPPRTWSETLAYSKVLTEFNKDGSLKRAGFLPNYGNSWLYLYSFQNNASFLSPDGRTCTIDSPEVQQALEFMIKGYELVGGYAQADRFQSSFRGSENDPFLLGQVAMIIHGDWMLSGFARFKPDLDFGTVPPPVPDDRFNRTGRFANEKDQFITWAGGFSWAIPRGAKNVDLAWEFMKWITSEEGRLVEMRSNQKFQQSRGRRFIPKIQGLISANEQAIKEFASGTTPFDEAIQNHVSIMDRAEMRPATFAAQVLWDEHVRAADQAMRGSTTPSKALASARDNVQKMLDEELEKEQFAIIDLHIPLWLGIGAVALTLIGGFGYVLTRRQGALGRHETLWGYIFISPWLIGFLVFTLGPMVASLFFSFTQYNVLTPARWVGINNYVELFQSGGPLLIKAFNNVLFLAVVGIPLGIITGLAIALLLRSDLKGMRIYRTIYYLPAVVPGVVTVVLWMFILNADPNRGLFNSFWQATLTQWFGGAPPNWLGDENWVKPALILMGLWGAGSGMILWLAGLKGIPTTLYEAASIDGATPVQQFWKVTIPQLSPLIFFNVVMGVIGALQTFDQIYIITGGQGSGPNDSLLVPVYMLFTNAFSYFRMGWASALAWLIFVIILAITVVQFVLAKRWVHTEVAK